MKKILLANAMGPYAKGWGEVVSDLFSARLSRDQGPFTLKSSVPAFALHLIVENLDADTVVMEWPTEKLFRAELKKGYDFLGIQVKTIHMPAIARMVKIAREIAPKTKIVLGGYGVAQIYNPMPHDPDNDAGYLRENADHICCEEGVGFFRKLIGQPADDPISQKMQPVFETTIPGAESLVCVPLSSTLVALGCPNACEFCTTTHFFRFKKITVSTPEQACASLKAAHERMAGMPPLFDIIWDEDFLIDRNYVLRLGELLQAEGLIGKVNLFCFASIRSISQYTVEELVRSGVGAMWIGIESKFNDDIVTGHNFQKRIGRDVKEVIEELHDHGILVIASNILGLDFHNHEKIREEIDYFVSLKPDFYQVTPLTPCPGTALYDRMLEEGRIEDDFSTADAMIWSDVGLKHNNFVRGDIQSYYHLAHKKLYETNGPSILNILEVMLKGYRTMRHSPDPFLQARAERCYFFAKKLGGGVLYSIRKLAPATPAVTARIEAVEKEYRELIGEYNPIEKIVQRAALGSIKTGSQSAKKERPPYIVTRINGTETGPKVIKRQNALRHSLRRVTTGVVRQGLGLKYRSMFPIRLADIDDFDVRFNTMEIEGNRMNYVDEGQGPTLLMLHGNPTWSYLYRHLIRDLKQDFRCMALDHLGYGLSDKPPQADYSMDAHIRRLGIFIEKMGLSDITLVCQDWGGIIGLSYAAHNKDRFSRLIPMNTTGFLPGSGKEFRQCMSAWAFPYLWSFKIPVLGKKMAMDWDVFLQAGMRLGTYNSRRMMHRKAMRGYMYPFQRVQDRIAIMKSVRQVPMGPWNRVWHLLRDTETALTGWDVRTRLIWGMKDPVFVPWFIEKFEAILPNHARTLKISTAGHFLQDDEPEIIALGIREFMRDKLVPSESSAFVPLQETASCETIEAV